MLNGVIKRPFDITEGMPPGAIVYPAGGQWHFPNLTVTLTLTAFFMAGLGVGNHQFFLTGVSQRGLPNFALVELTVT
jgi:hypothetical protein